MGTIIGVSGGACNIGKNIALFKLFTSNLNVGLSNRKFFNSLELTYFGFLPHYNQWNQEFKDSIKKYSEKAGNLIYACNDGDGIIINNGEVELIGNIVTIKNGKEI
jgi:dipeptidase E